MNAEELISRAYELESGRVLHGREAYVFYGKASASNRHAAIAAGRLSITALQSGLLKRQGQVLENLRRAAATSDAASMRKLAIYTMYVNKLYDHESMGLLYQAFQKGDYLAGYVLTKLYQGQGDIVFQNLPIHADDHGAICLRFLEQSARLGCVAAGSESALDYWRRGERNRYLFWYHWAAERGDVVGVQNMLMAVGVSHRRQWPDLGVFVIHATRLSLACFDNAAAQWLVLHFADVSNRDFDLVAAIRFRRRSFGNVADSKHGLDLFGDHLWEVDRVTSRGSFVMYLRDDLLVNTKLFNLPLPVVSE